MGHFPIKSILLAGIILGGQVPLQKIEHSSVMLKITMNQRELSQKISLQLRQMNLDTEWPSELPARLVTRLHLLHYNHQRLLHLSANDRDRHQEFQALSKEVQIIVESGLRFAGSY